MPTIPPRLLRDFDPPPGVIKADYGDFQVEEIPLYPADGSGTHTYFLLEKTGLSTMQAVADLARALNVPRHAIGFAGLKDARAVTRQWLSVEHVEPAVVQALDIPRLRVLDVTRHTNKLRLGHLKGNSFLIKIREAEPARLPELQDALATLARRGVPNYFGPQRFGQRGDAWAIGQAILRNGPEEALDILLGRPAETDAGRIRHARELYEQGAYGDAVRHWPAMFHDERRALKTLAGHDGDKRRAFRTVDRRTRDFYVSAYQSWLFNRVVAARLDDGLDRLHVGDLAWRHPTGAVFHVEDAAREQPRADCFEISPSGPLFGYRMTETAGWPGELEYAVLAEEQLSRDAFRAGPLRVKGARRPLRFPVSQPNLCLGADGRGPYLELSLSLPSGCYATAVLRELIVEPTREAAAPDLDGTEESGQ